VAQRVEAAENRSEPPAPYGDKITDRNGLMIENFGLPCNLMLSIPANIVEGGLEDCLQAIRSKPTVAA